MLFREKLVELREAKGLSQTALAETSGVALGTIRKIEQGSTNQRLNFSFVVALAKALGTDCGAFAGCEDVQLDDPPAALPAPPPPPPKPKP
jgi:transcriptional regulator with XRE-family HTH domain